jgi:polar amino acid transport system substrate-binding protein
MTSSRITTRRTTRPGIATVVLASATLLLSACNGAANATTGAAGAVSSAAGGINTSPEQHRVKVTKDEAAAALLPIAIRRRGTIIIGAGFGAGAPPLGFYADDNKTPIGIETDIAQLVADKLGVKADLQVTSWENLFIGLDSAKYDVGFSNVTVTEARKEKYDFATYRKDNISFEAKKGSGWTVKTAKDIAGKTIAVASGTNQEKILVDWNTANVKAGLPEATIKYYQSQTDTYLALASGRIDANFGPNPSAAYHVATGRKTEIIGTFSGAGDGLQGLIAATTKKDSGVVNALAAAVNSAIADGSYAKVLERWNLTNEAVTKSQINPPGLPKTN